MAASEENDRVEISGIGSTQSRYGKAQVGAVHARKSSVKVKRRKLRHLVDQRAVDRLRDQTLQSIKNISSSVESLTTSVTGLTAQAIRTGNDINALHKRIDTFKLEEEAHAIRANNEIIALHKRIDALIDAYNREEEEYANRASSEIQALHQRIDALIVRYNEEEDEYAERITGAIADLQRQLQSLSQQVAAITPRDTAIANQLQPRLNTSIVIETDAGPVAGTLTEVGVDYVAITEASGAIVLIPTSQINSFQ